MKMPNCPYCDLPMQSLGRIEGEDELGLYVAEIWICATCGYCLEKDPIYLDFAEDDSC